MEQSSSREGLFGGDAPTAKLIIVQENTIECPGAHGGIYVQAPYEATEWGGKYHIYLLSTSDGSI